MSTVINPAIAPSPARALRAGAGRHPHHHPRPDQVFRRLAAVRDFNLDIPKGKIVSVFGPNGCGKSTLINMIAGLIPIDAGEILFDGKSLAQTKIGYVFQNYREAMFPWLRTIDNIAYPLRLEGRGKAEVDARVEELVASFDVKFDLKRYPTSCPADSSRPPRSCARWRRDPRCCSWTSRSRRWISR